MIDLGVTQSAVSFAFTLGGLCGFFCAAIMLVPWYRVPCLFGRHNWQHHPDDEAGAHPRECWDCDAVEARQ